MWLQWRNDYPVTAATIEDLEQRRVDEREGIYKTLGALYYFQVELGVPWSVAEDEGYATEANRTKMKALHLRPDMESLAVQSSAAFRTFAKAVGLLESKVYTAKDLTRLKKPTRQDGGCHGGLFHGSRSWKNGSCD